MFELIVRAIIQDRIGKVLLVKRGREPEKNKWSLVGGKVEFGEKADDAVKREIHEELSVEFKPKFVFYTEYPDNKRKVHSLMLYFTGRFSGKIKVKPDEILAYKFVDLKEINLMHDIAWDHKKQILRYLSTN